MGLPRLTAESARKVSDVVGNLCRRLPLSRATIVRILKECHRLADVKVNPAVFIDRVAEAIGQALYDQVADGIVYHPDGKAWSADLIRERHQDETVAPRVVAVTRVSPITSSVTHRWRSTSPAPSTADPTYPSFSSCLSGSRCRRRSAIVREEAAGWFVYLVRETKGHSDIDKLRFESEGWKIKFGQAHFDAIGVDYAFGDKPESLIVPSRRRPPIPVRHGRRESGGPRWGCSVHDAPPRILCEQNGEFEKYNPKAQMPAACHLDGDDGLNPRERTPHESSPAPRTNAN